MWCSRCSTFHLGPCPEEGDDDRFDLYPKFEPIKSEPLKIEPLEPVEPLSYLPPRLDPPSLPSYEFLTNPPPLRDFAGEVSWKEGWGRDIVDHTSGFDYTKVGPPEPLQPVTYPPSNIERFSLPSYEFLNNPPPLRDFADEMPWDEG